MTLVLSLAPPRSRVGARAAFQVGSAFAGSLLIAGLAQLSIPLPFTPVPITGQTLGVLLVGAAYGPVLGSATVLLYLAWGALGMPVYAGATGGHEVLGAASATGGYLWGFALAGGLTGTLARAGWDRSFGSAMGAMFLGEVAIYAVGIPWLMAALGIPLGKALELGLAPFVIGDAMKIVLAAAALPGAWRLLARFEPEAGAPDDDTSA
jgi:biotin transport system substrate-specific component